ncbi:MAG: hypothetical protein DRH76_10765, partial [Deltaproteobacteria bacterium]
MEKQLAKDGITKNQQAMLDWLGVDSFDDITTEHHEKFAETFEVYLMEGKAPSVKLRPAFAAFRRWLLSIYRLLKQADPRLARSQLDPQIIEIFDAMLATEVEIAEAMGSPAYDQYFRSQSQAGMTDDEWREYQKTVLSRKAAATEDAEKKLFKLIKSRRTAEWNAEKKDIYLEEMELLADLPIYRAMARARIDKLDRGLMREVLGLPPVLSQEERKAQATTIRETDSLLVAAARKGGLNLTEWELEGVDPDYAKNKRFNNQIFGHPIFRKNSGLLPDDLAELANEYGYRAREGGDVNLREVLELVDQELRGDPVYTPEGQMQRMDEEFGEQENLPIARLDKFSTKEDGADPKKYAEVGGFDSTSQFLMSMMNTPNIQKAARENAQQRMLDKYGDPLNDGTLEAEVQESAHNDEQAKMLIAEIRALGRKAGKVQRIDRDYLKAEAHNMVQGMTYREIQPGKYDRAEIKAAKRSVAHPEQALEYKTQQLINHYLYREAVTAREKMQKQRKYVRKVPKQKISVKQIDKEYLANRVAIAKMYNFSSKKAQQQSVDEILNWYATQIANEMVDIQLFDVRLIEALANRELGEPYNFDLITFDQLTAGDMQGLYDQLAEMRYIGGQLAEGQRAEIAATIDRFAESILANGGKDKPYVRGLPREGETRKRKIQEDINSLPSVRNLLRKL